MKKLSRKQWERDVINGVLNRQGRRNKPRSSRRVSSGGSAIRGPINKWIDDKIANNQLNISISRKRDLTIFLPENLNFNTDYEQTSLYMAAIRKLASHELAPKLAYRLSSVNFDNLKTISTSAALVLTAELSKWDDVIRQRLKPSVDNWDPDILQKLKELGFFALFEQSPEELCQSQHLGASSVSLVRYIKGRCGDNDKARILKQEILDVVGENICKWTFLHGGLTEAITNVTHHAYPSSYNFSERSKTWYLSGSYNRKTKELKIVFYDQGIGIPKSLPASRVWERVLSVLSVLPIAERKRDEVLLKAAVQVSRTSTGSADRGKGLQDLLEFIRQRQEGYLSILSLRGLYKLTVRGGRETTKSEHFNNRIQGTLIIWSATLND